MVRPLIQAKRRPTPRPRPVHPAAHHNDETDTIIRVMRASDSETSLPYAMMWDIHVMRTSESMTPLRPAMKRGLRVVRTSDSETPLVPGVKWGIHLVMLSLFLLFPGCVSTQMSSTGETSVDRATKENVEPLIRREVDRWAGTPHVLGGSTVAGMDCSAFVQRIFADALRLNLPRTTEEQVEVGQRVNLSELQSGDLVFFQPPTKTNHVGIYLNDGEFAHVSSTDGVSISQLDLPYWRTSYWTSRRVLPEDGYVAVSEPETERAIERPAPIEPRPNARRVGW